MSEFTAKDVQALRQATGAGMMDAKKALQENGGDATEAAQWLREKGLAKVAKLGDRENTQGSVAAVVDGQVGALVELKSETDFSAKADDFTSLVQELAERVVAKGTDGVADLAEELDALKIAKKENIELGKVVRFDAAEGNVLDSYLHIQDGRGVNGVLVELQGGTKELAHDIAVHIAFTKPQFLSRDEVPADEAERERQALLDITKAEGKPEQAWPKIVDGRMGGWYKERVLLEQGFVRDEKQTITQLLGDATVVRFAQVFIGA
ncbi:translation elongation factor Ts [Rhabdothermincola salaria]|uniref:translation elongation factor Ts n=1 Tax=Rhabdothermincola salaria TaxID=2903142 RepID=UPI001E466551|nr:translation elongation factor Ts [Rhabdothermincola salaria]MCD9624927.1 translation elongation factor Ts [Rhabdothermincola salaria]